MTLTSTEAALDVMYCMRNQTGVFDACAFFVPQASCSTMLVDNKAHWHLCWVSCSKPAVPYSAIAYKFFAQPHWISACLMILHGPKALQLLQCAIKHTSKISPCSITIER